MSSTVASTMSRTSSFQDDSLTEDLDNLVAVDDRSVDGADGHEGQHPALRSVCVVDCSKTTRIIPNGPPAVLENDCFEGKVMLLMRTPDVDNPKDVHRNEMHATPKRISQYFKGKKRRFEFQFQIKLKKVPTGPLFLGCELENHNIKVGTITKGLVNILLAMVRRINPGFHFSWGADLKTHTKQDFESGNYEKPHLSFPVEASMDRIVITKPGEEPPELGYELHETNESIKRRRRLGAGCVEWNLEDTYTMCLYSAYADWISWRSMNVPGMSPFSMSRVTGTQPIYLSVYEISGYSNADYKKQRPPHTRKQLQVYARLEFTNNERTIGGLAERIGCKSTLEAHPESTHSDRSLPDTDLDSDCETASRVTMS